MELGTVRTTTTSLKTNGQEGPEKTTEEWIGAQIYS